MNEGIRKFILMKVLMSLAGYPDDVISAAGYTKERCYTDALALTKSLRSDYNYRLLDDYTQIFDVDNQVNDEIIWYNIRLTKPIMAEVKTDFTATVSVGTTNLLSTTKQSQPYGAIPYIMGENIAGLCHPYL